jgi:hypothetical protein
MSVEGPGSANAIPANKEVMSDPFAMKFIFVSPDLGGGLRETRRFDLDWKVNSP